MQTTNESWGWSISCIVYSFFFTCLLSPAWKRCICYSKTREMKPSVYHSFYTTTGLCLSRRSKVGLICRGLFSWVTQHSWQATCQNLKLWRSISMSECLFLPLQLPSIHFSFFCSVALLLLLVFISSSHFTTHQIHNSTSSRTLWEALHMINKKPAQGQSGVRRCSDHDQTSIIPGYIFSTSHAPPSCIVT